MCTFYIYPMRWELPIAEYKARLENERKDTIANVVRSFERALDGTETEEERRIIFDLLWRREGTHPYQILELIDKLSGEHAPGCKVVISHPGGVGPHSKSCCRGAF